MTDPTLPTGPDLEAIISYLTTTYPATDIVTIPAAWFFSLDPEKHWPNYATIVTNDEHDQASDLSRPGVFWLNIGVGKETFRSLFGKADDGGHDFTALDRLMPHPVYGKMYWVCVLNPGPATSEAVRGLLAEAYESDRQRRVKQA